jgi:hypothetical protein
MPVNGSESKSNTANSQAVSALVKQLKQTNAPAALLAKFESLVAINNRLPSNAKASIEELMLDACKEFNFTKPFEADGRKRSFRARLLPENHSDYRADVGGNFVFRSENSPGEEQAYRRGYDQGFHLAFEMFKEKKSVKQFQEQADKIQNWRVAQVQVIGTLPGGDETFTLGLNFRRNGIGLKLRYQVLKRDDFKCQTCGLAASDGVTLEIDHVLPVSKGGANDLENLQTLCFECNRGKSDDH